MTILERSDRGPGAEILPALPSARHQLWRVLRTMLRRRIGPIVIPAMSVEVPALHPDSRRLEAYTALCGFHTRGLPVTFPQVQALGLQIHLMTRRQFPLPLLGVVHVRNVIRQIHPLESARDYRVRVDVQTGGVVQAGVEFAVGTRYYDHGTLVWEAVATGLHRARNRPRRSTRTSRTELLDRFEPCATFDAMSDIGRRYARVSGDMNPIHLWPLSGRLFGFPGHIAHGMWSLARCLALLQDELPAAPIEIAVDFKQPLVLPARVSLLRSSRTDAMEFALTAHDRSRLHLLGTVRSGLAQPSVPAPTAPRI